MSRLTLPNGQPAMPQIDGVQLACAMLLNGRDEHLAPPDQAVAIVERIDALLAELAERGRKAKDNGG